ncbi:hypothetical protein TNCV_1767431 [Trichonephila clavipes]|nr:hypothetical protein TNCV_1767431 [Trichonephila clavipes]
MSTEATMIRTMRSSTVTTVVSHTNDFRWPQKKKSKGLRYGERRGQAADPWLTIPCFMLICRPHADYNHSSEFVGLIRQHPVFPTLS